MNTQFINVLISSVSRKVPLVKAVRKALDKVGVEGKIIGADANSECIGGYFVDQFWEMPLLSEITTEEFISFCQFYNVNRVIPSRDGELLFYANNRQKFAQQGIHVMVSGKEAMEICLDKFLFYQTLSGLGYPAIETTLSVDELECESYVVKEQYGAGGRNIGLDLTKEEAAEYAKKLNSPIFQPFIKGEEISVDMYLDKSGKTKGVVTRKRDLVINGESQITTTFQNDAIDKMCANMAEELMLSGHVMFQCIHNENNGVYHVLESNPRFGGASCLSLEMGLDSFYWFFLEAVGDDLSKHPFKRGDKEKRLVRHPEDLIL